MKTKLFLLAAFVFCAVKANADIQYSGTCGEHVTWRINTFIPDDYNPYPPQYNNGDTLYIEGYGEMTDYSDYYSAPWSPNNIHFYDIKYISIQEGVTSIGKYAFSYMAQYGNGLWITIPNTVTTIGFSAFMSSHISQINIPNSVTTIGKHAFEGCQLFSIDIPSSVMDIGLGAFWYCTGLHSFKVAADNPNYSSPNGLLCNKEQTILIQCPADMYESEFAFPNTITTILKYAFWGCYYSNIIIPNSVTTIENYAFANCENLQSISIPASVTSIGNCAFYRCSYMQSIDVASGNPNYSSIGGVLFNKEQNTLVAYPPGRIGAYSIPNGVTTIANEAFHSCQNLTAITFPNSITDIGASAFYYCTSLVSVTIPDGVTTIKRSSFGDCKNLSFVTIGKNVKTIEYYAFAGSYALRDVVIPEGVKTIGNSAFAGYNLNSVTIPSSVDSIGHWAFESDHLETVYNYSKVPQTISRDVFCYSMYDEVNGTLYVPEESIALYQAADVWKEFNPILPLPKTEAINNIHLEEKPNKTTKKVVNGQVFILRGDKTYTVTGQEVK